MDPELVGRPRALPSDSAGRLRISLIEDPAGCQSLAELFDEVWDHPNTLPAGVMRALAHSGAYVSGAWLDGVLVAGSVAWHTSAAGELHSHIAGVRAAARGVGVGVALKEHQRLWAADHQMTTISWTYDPLVARNAWFNLTRLGARPVRYLVDFYGPMADGINRGDASDRLLVHWAVRPEAKAPSRSPTRTVAVPADIESLRRLDPATAAQWRLKVRHELGESMNAAWRVVGFDRLQGYLLAATGETEESPQ